MTDALPNLRFDERGLVPVVAQDAESGEILMLAYANLEALTRTLATGEAHYFSRSRGTLWRKGATSGHIQNVVEVRYDCDADALLYRVGQTGPACHTGERSCFFRSMIGERGASLGETLTMLEGIIDARLSELPEGSYITSLHHQGMGRMAQKVIEEAGESAVAALEGKREELVLEAADLLFHLMVMLRKSDVRLKDIVGELESRHRKRTDTLIP
jgi:phosphoribosyl-AMP cyclohydrolase / phosphoribosyl-ATP pyrophosphohydrolase